MKKLLLIALTTFTASAHAWEPELYAGSNVGFWQYKQSDVFSSFTLHSIEGLVGMTLFPNLAIEARAGAGLTTGREHGTGLADDGQGAEVEIDMYTQIQTDYYASAYFRPFLKNDKASLYGLIGVTTIAMDNLYNGSSWSPTETDMSFGVGVSFVMTPSVDVTAEWKKLINSDEFNIRGGTIGFTYSF